MSKPTPQITETQRVIVNGLASTYLAFCMVSAVVFGGYTIYKALTDKDFQGKGR